ncbi:hypothetical protein E2C01_055748 [Portunus trituberculatus]|uniref:Uncharacterized protein n=1 Tax=Portunus trituberculatus TaxID=210409 RepID=A0A5B7GVK7_PORTR|nr:hypothetical protein [Portunus trituberculatus]
MSILLFPSFSILFIIFPYHFHSSIPSFFWGDIQLYHFFFHTFLQLIHFYPYFPIIPLHYLFFFVFFHHFSHFSSIFFLPLSFSRRATSVTDSRLTPNSPFPLDTLPCPSAQTRAPVSSSPLTTSSSPPRPCQHQLTGKQRRLVTVTVWSEFSPPD